MIYKVLLTEHAMEVDLFQYRSVVIEVFIYFYFIFQDRAFLYSTGYTQTQLSCCQHLCAGITDV